MESIIQQVRGLKSDCCGWPVSIRSSALLKESQAWYECTHCRKPCNALSSRRPAPRLAEALQAHAVDPRVARLPKWAQNLIAGLITERNELLK